VSDLRMMIEAVFEKSFASIGPFWDLMSLRSWTAGKLRLVKLFNNPMRVVTVLFWNMICIKRFFRNMTDVINKIY